MRRPKFKDASEIRYQINDGVKTLISSLYRSTGYLPRVKGQEKSSTRDDVAFKNLVL